MSISISQLVSVTPNTITPAGNAVDTLGLFISNSQSLPSGVITSYSSLEDVGSDFEPNTPEYKNAAVYFKGYTNCTQLPKAIYFARYDAGSATPAQLTGGNLGTTGVDQIKALTGGISIQVGKTTLKADSVDFSTIKTLSDAANVLQGSLDKENKTIKIAFNSTGSNFVITTIAVGAGTTISAATGALAAPLKLDSGVVKISEGTSPQDPKAFMNSIVELNSNWVTFTTIYGSSMEDKLAFSEWTDSQRNYIYVDSESPDLSSKDFSKTWWGQVSANKSNNTAAFYEDADVPVYPAFYMSIAACYDFNRTRGRTVFAYRNQNGLKATDITTTQASALLEAGYNIYGDYSGKKESFNFLQAGRISGQFKWSDTAINAIWLNSNLQLKTIYVFQNNNLLPYNQVGYDILLTAWDVQCQQAVNFGAIQRGVNIGQDELSIVTGRVGKDISQTLYTQGYYIDIKPANDATRIERGSPECTLYYVDGGSIQNINLVSAVIL